MSVQTITIAAIYVFAAIEFFAIADAQWRREDEMRWGKLPRLPRRRITHALQRLVNWVDKLSGPQHKES